MECLVISTPLLSKEGKNKIVEACVANSSLGNIRETVILRSSTTEVSNTFENMGVKLHAKQGVELDIFI